MEYSYTKKRKRKNSDITQRINTKEINILCDPNSAWSHSNYIPLAIVKLLISQTFRTHGKLLSLETLADLQSVLEIPTEEENDKNR